MSKIIYVYPSGEAHDIDQVHEFALFYGQYRETLAGRFEGLKEAVVALWESIRPAVEEMVRNIRSAMVWMEEVVEHVDNHMDRKGRINEWRRTRNKHDWECHLKIKSNRQTNIIRPTDWPKFRKSQRRG